MLEKCSKQDHFRGVIYMAKESATSSAAKKKKAAKKKVTTKKTAPKTTSAAAKKAKSPAKKTTAAKKITKTTAKKKTSAGASKVAPSAKKLSPKEILLQKFTSWKPDTFFSVPLNESEQMPYSAPPFFQGKTDLENDRLGKLLLKKFDYDSIINDGIAAMKAEEEARRKAEEAEARKKAAEEAKLQKMMQKAEDARLAEAAQKAELERLANLTNREKLSLAMKESKPMNKSMIYAGAFIAFIFAVLIFASASNVNNYYLKTTEKGVEIWQGKFAPLGQKMVLSMPGVKAPETLKSSYSKDEVYPLAFQYYVNSAKRLLEFPGIPDFKKIKAEFGKAFDYATMQGEKELINDHLTTIDLMILTYKAEVFADSGTIDGFQKALDYLGEATNLELNANQIRLVEQKMNQYRDAAQTVVITENGDEKAAEEVGKLYSWKNVRRQGNDAQAIPEVAAPEKEEMLQETIEATAEDVQAQKETAEKITTTAEAEDAGSAHEPAGETSPEAAPAHH